MKMSVIALGIGATVGLAATVGGVRSGSEAHTEVAHGIVAGVILGSRVWPYGWTAPHADSQSRLQLLSSVCRAQGQCSGYGLAASTLIDGSVDDR